MSPSSNETTSEDSKPTPPPSPTPPAPNYTGFTRLQKYSIISLAAYAAWFSALSSFIYYPALPQLAAFFSMSPGIINLTVTSYMAVATMAPSLIGDAADVLGRRPVYVLALGLYFVANVAIALAESYAALVGLRVLQALAISGEWAVLEFCEGAAGCGSEGLTGWFCVV